MSEKRVNFKLRLARQGWFSELPYPKYIDGLDGSTRSDMNSDIKGSIRLHRTVIDRTLLSTYSSKVKERDQALQWFNLKDDDFIQVCEMACLNPDWVYKVSLELHRKFLDKTYCTLVGDELILS